MAIVTMTTTIENNPVRLPLPEQADITVVDASTGAIVYTLHVTDAGMLIIDDADASDTAVSHSAVFDNTVAHAAVSNSDVPDADASVTAEAASEATDTTAPEAEAEVDTEPEDDVEATTTDTVTKQFTGVVDADRVCVTITYDINHGVLVGDADGRVITTADLADLMRLAQRYNAPVAMTFDIPHRGMTTFDGYLETNYRGMNGTLYNGVVLLGAQGGAQVFNDDDTLADDMRVVREIDIRFAAEDVRSDDSIVVATPDDDADDSDNDGDDDDTDAEDDADTTPTARKMCATTWARSRSHINAESWVDIAHYAAQHDLAVKADIFDYDTATAQGVCTGRLVAEHGDGYTFVLVDDVHGRAPIDLFPGTSRAGFTWLTVFSDTTIDTTDTENVGDSAYMQTPAHKLAEHFRERFGALDTTDLAIDSNDADAGADSTADSTATSARKIYATLRADDPDDVHMWRTIGAYAKRHGLSVQARVRSAFAGEDGDVYVGKLKANNTFDGVYALIDKSKGNLTVDLAVGATIGATTRGFTTLTVFSDAEMRRQGFRGTNERDYTEVSVAQLHDYLHEHFGDYSN